jgi:hypothetical protein
MILLLLVVYLSTARIEFTIIGVVVIGLIIIAILEVTIIVERVYFIISIVVKSKAIAKRLDY